MITRTFAEYAAGVSYESLPEEAIAAAEKVFLDWLGNVYAGAATPTARLVHGVISETGSVPEATLIGFAGRASALDAALVNGASSHIVEFDDIYKNGLYHPGGPTNAAALAVAEKLRLSGRRMIAAIVVGYEVGTRISEAINPSHYRYWHTTATVGNFGAAAAAGNLLGLDAEQMAWALGSAGTQASGLWQFLDDGELMSKPLHVGRAASNGVLAALLARRGFNGATRILEGDKGFCAATSEGWNFDRVLATLGREYNVASITFKAYASCGHTHPSIDAALAVVAAHGVRPEAVERVRVRTYGQAHSLCANPSPQNPYQAKFSIPFCVATALRFGLAGTAEFAQERVDDPETAALMSRVEVAADPEMSKLAPAKRPAMVEITTQGGQSYSHRVDFRKGDPENPPTLAELKDKFRDLSSASLSPEEARATLETVSRLREIEDVSRLLLK